MIKKRFHPRFRVPNLFAKSRSRVPDRWRKQRGIDNKKRREQSGYGASPKIGYKNSNKVRFLRQDGTSERLIHNEKELLMIENSKNISIRFAHDLSKRKRLMLQKIAQSKNIKVVNKWTQKPEEIKNTKTANKQVQADSKTAKEDKVLK